MSNWTKTDSVVIITRILADADRPGLLKALICYRPLSASTSDRFTTMATQGQKRLHLLQQHYFEIIDSGQTLDRQALIQQFPELTGEIDALLAAFAKTKSNAVDVTKLQLLPKQAGAPAEDETVLPAVQLDHDATVLARNDEHATETFSLDLPSTDRSGSSPKAGTSLRCFGEYELLGEIARGGMGVVHKARQINLNRVVALKMILAGQLASEEHVRRFHTEAEAAANLDHPGIVPIYEVGEQNGVHYFSMGFVEGGSLEAKCRDKILSCREAADIAKAIADALDYAHQRGVIHRDIKPHNILIGTDGRPRITDFGLAKLTDRDSDLTGSGQIMGTAAYMPPEQATGRTSEAGPTADVYALGATLYRCVTGRPPFQAASTVEILRQVVEDEPVSPRRLNQEVDEDLQTIILKCLEKSPASRYSSAGLVSAELQRYLNGEPILARPVGAVSRLWRWCRRRPFVAASLLLSGFLFLAVAVGGPLLLWQQQKIQTSEVRRVAQQERDSRRLKESETRERLAQLEQERADVRTAQELERRQQAEELAKANAARAATHEYHAKIREVREMRVSRGAGWTSKALAILQGAAALPADGKDPVELRSLVAEVLLSSDVRLLGTVWGNREEYYAVDVSPDGTMLAAAQSKGTPVSSVHLYATMPAEDDDQPRSELQHVRSLSISTVGDKLRSLLKSTGLTSTATPGYRSVRFSPDGRRVAAGTRGGHVVIWDLEKQGSSPMTDVIVSRSDPPGTIAQVEFSPDGQVVYAWASTDRRVYCISTESGELLGSPIYATGFAVLSDGSLTSSQESWGRYFRATADQHPLQAPPESAFDIIHATDGRDIVVGSRAGEMILGNPWTLSRVLGLQPPGKLTLLPDAAGWFTSHSLSFAAPVDPGTVAIWDGLSGEFINSVPAGSNDQVAVTISPTSNLLYVHRDAAGQVFEIRESKSLGLSSGDLTEKLEDMAMPSHTIVPGGDRIEQFAMTADGAHLYSLEQYSRADARIRRVRTEDGIEEGRWKCSWIGLNEGEMTEIQGAGIAAVGETGEVVAALPVPGGFVKCSDDGFRLLDNPWGQCEAVSFTETEPRRTVVKFSAIADGLPQVRYRPTVSMWFPRELRQGQEKIKVRFYGSDRDRTLELDARTIESSGWYLLQFDELLPGQVSQVSTLAFDMESDELRFSTDDRSESKSVIFCQFGALCPVMEWDRPDKPRRIGPICAQADGIITGILDDTLLLRWQKNSISPELRWSDAVNDFAHLRAVVAGLESMVYTNWVGHAYQLKNIQDVHPLQKQLRGEHRATNDVATLSMTPDGSFVVAGNAGGELVCYTMVQGSEFDSHRVAAHRDSVTAVAVSSDGQLVASGSQSGELCLWNRNGDRLDLSMTLKLTERPWKQLMFQGNSTNLCILRENERGIRILDLDHLMKILKSLSPTL